LDARQEFNKVFSEEVGRAGVGVIRGIGHGEREEEETYEKPVAEPSAPGSGSGTK